MENVITIIYPAEFHTAYTVVTEDSDATLLERVFAEWNGGSGMESEKFESSKVRSLSVGDIVAINGNYYQCKSFGWKHVDPNFVDDLVEKIENHPSYKPGGAWFTHNKIRWEENKEF